MSFSSGDDAEFSQGGASGADGSGETRNKAADGAKEARDGSREVREDRADGVSAGEGGEAVDGGPATAGPGEAPTARKTGRTRGGRASRGRARGSRAAQEAAGVQEAVSVQEASGAQDVPGLREPSGAERIPGPMEAVGPGASEFREAPGSREASGDAKGSREASVDATGSREASVDATGDREASGAQEPHVIHEVHRPREPHKPRGASRPRGAHKAPDAPAAPEAGESPAAVAAPEALEAPGGSETPESAEVADAGRRVAGLPPEPRPDKPNFLTSARFADFDLPQKIIDGLDAAGFLYATPIQAMVIPEALKGKDIAGQAQTGTGKTVAFLVPVMARLMSRPSARQGLTRALVVTPTRELAEQIYTDGKKLAAFTGLSLSLVIGGMDYREQARALESGPDIVVGTPGRLTDYIHKHVFNTQGVEVSIVDEADRLLELGFIRDLKFILSRLPSYETRQTMLFSATLSHQILELVYNFMNPPQYITAEPGQQSRDQIVQELYHVSRSEKLSLLLGLLKREEHSRVIIFCNTKSGVEWLAKKLVANGYHAEGITGDLPQPKRLRLMQSFKDNQLDIMVATDVASRGIHVEDVSHVFNYDIPQDAEDYVHRIGRTARAGKTGKAVSFACEEYVHHLDAIENILGAKIPVIFADDDLFEKDRSGDPRRRGDPKGARGGDGHARDGHARDGYARDGHARDGQARDGQTRDAKDARDMKDARDVKEARDFNDGKGADGKGLAGARDAQDTRDQRPARPAFQAPRPAAGSHRPATPGAPRGGYNGHGGPNGGRDPREEIFGSRGLAFSGRPGGVFGLAPRQPVNALHPDVRYELSWKPEDIVSLPHELPTPPGDRDARIAHAVQAAAAEAEESYADIAADYEADLPDGDRQHFGRPESRDGFADDVAEPRPEPAGDAPEPPAASFVVSPEAAAERSRVDALGAAPVAPRAASSLSPMPVASAPAPPAAAFHAPPLPATDSQVPAPPAAAFQAPPLPATASQAPAPPAAASLAVDAHEGVSQGEFAQPAAGAQPISGQPGAGGQPVEGEAHSGGRRRRRRHRSRHRDSQAQGAAEAASTGGAILPDGAVGVWSPSPHPSFVVIEPKGEEGKAVPDGATELPAPRADIAGRLPGSDSDAVGSAHRAEVGADAEALALAAAKAEADEAARIAAEAAEAVRIASEAEAAEAARIASETEAAEAARIASEAEAAGLAALVAAATVQAGGARADASEPTPAKRSRSRSKVMAEEVAEAEGAPKPATKPRTAKAKAAETEDGGVSSKPATKARTAKARASEAEDGGAPSKPATKARTAKAKAAEAEDGGAPSKPAARTRTAKAKVTEAEDGGAPSKPAARTRAAKAKVADEGGDKATKGEAKPKPKATAKAKETKEAKDAKAPKAVKGGPSKASKNAAPAVKPKGSGPSRKG
ncbi:MAG: DEAD/DEAH box helicase [Deltaproteobacteria bacterium]|jgi:ATP-dependent RNA helicase RhlB|nr:DEAD/DEAH box helicase [Deltaproteobacteria bacterium]